MQYCLNLTLSTDLMWIWRAVLKAIQRMREKLLPNYKMIIGSLVCSITQQKTRLVWLVTYLTSVYLPCLFTNAKGEQTLYIWKFYGSSNCSNYKEFISCADNIVQYHIKSWLVLSIRKNAYLRSLPPTLVGIDSLNHRLPRQTSTN